MKHKPLNRRAQVVLMALSLRINPRSDFLAVAPDVNLSTTVFAA